MDDSPISQGEALDLEARIGRDVVRTDRQEPFYYPEISDPSVDIQRPHLASLTRILLKYARLHPEISKAASFPLFLQMWHVSLHAETLAQTTCRV